VRPFLFLFVVYTGSIPRPGYRTSIRNRLSISLRLVLGVARRGQIGIWSLLALLLACLFVCVEPAELGRFQQFSLLCLWILTYSWAISNGRGGVEIKVHSQPSRSVVTKEEPRKTETKEHLVAIYTFRNP
jgi:hypothetical protein